MTRFHTKVAREVAADERKGGRAMVAAQLQLACDALDRERQRSEIFRDESKDLRADLAGLETFVATWLAATTRYCDTVEESGPALVHAFIESAGDTGSTEEALHVLMIDRVEITMDHISLASRMAKRVTPELDLNARIARVAAERGNAALGCPCPLCDAERASQDKARDDSA